MRPSAPPWVGRWPSSLRTGRREPAEKPKHKYELISPVFQGKAALTADDSRRLCAGQLATVSFRTEEETIAMRIYRGVHGLDRADSACVRDLLDLDVATNDPWVNDAHGHLAGDRVLSAVGTRLKQLVREGDFVGRYGLIIHLRELPFGRNQDVDREQQRRQHGEPQRQPAAVLEDRPEMRLGPQGVEGQATQIDRLGQDPVADVGQADQERGELARSRPRPRPPSRRAGRS